MSSISSAKRAGNGRIKLLHIINDLSVGGAEMMLNRLLSVADREVFDPVVISLIDRGQVREYIEDLKIPVLTPGMKPSVASPAAVWRFVRLVRQLKPDLIHGWMYHGSLAAQLAHISSTTRAPVVWGIHNLITTLRAEKRVTAAVIKSCATLSKFPASIVFVSQANKTQHEALGYCSKKSRVIPNGFDASSFMPSAEARLAIRDELGLPHDTILIGLIGRFHPVKDHVNFLRAAAILARDNPEVRFILCGKGVDQHNLSLARMAGESGIAERVFLLGERRDINRVIAALDIAASSSVAEGFSSVVGEAMSCGVPCVITDVGDTPRVVGETGRVVPPRDPAAFAAAWKDMLELGEEGRRALGQAARQRIIERFSLQSVGRQYEKVYKSIVWRE